MTVTMIELTHVPGEELTHVPGEELTHEPGLPLEYAPKYLLDALGLGHLYNAALSVDNNPLPPTVPHAPKTLPNPPVTSRGRSSRTTPLGGWSTRRRPRWW